MHACSEQMKEEKTIRHPKEGTFCLSLHQPTHLHTHITQWSKPFSISIIGFYVTWERKLDMVVWGECPVKGVLEWKLRIDGILFITSSQICADVEEKNTTQA
jgi:hypothetical protein